MHEMNRSIPILMTCFFKWIFLNYFLKFDAIWWTQYIDETSGPLHPIRFDCKVTSKPVLLSDIIHKFGCGVTYLLK